MFRIEVIGKCCGQHGHCSFYKGLKISLPSATLQLESNKRNKEHNNSKHGSKYTTHDNNNLNHIPHKLDQTDKPAKNEAAIDNNDDRGNRILVIGLGDCIPVRPWSNSPIECLAEIQMIWKDKTEQSLLVSLRLYFLPENIPDGRNCHGEDEIVAVTEPAIIRGDDFFTWIVPDLNWNWGLVAGFNKDLLSTKLVSSANGMCTNSLLARSTLDFSDIEKEKALDNSIRTNVTILSYPRYCRYRAILKRSEGIEDDWIRTKLIETLSGFVASQPNTRIMFCKDSIEYPELESHEMLCNHLAPKVKSKNSRKQNPCKIVHKTQESPELSEYSVDEDECNNSDASDNHAHTRKREGKRSGTRLKAGQSESQQDDKALYTTLSTGRVTKQRMQLTQNSANGQIKKFWSDDDDTTSNDEDDDYNGDYVNRRNKQEKLQNTNNNNNNKKQSKIDKDSIAALFSMQNFQMPWIESIKDPDEREFMNHLNQFMIERALPYTKLIWMGLEKDQLYNLYNKVQKLGGYEAIANKPEIWSQLCDDPKRNDLQNQQLIRNKYELILLPFELYERKLRQKIEASKLEPNNGLFGMPSSSRTHIKKDRSDSPAIEIIPIKNANADRVELTKEQMTEIQNIVKQKDPNLNSNTQNSNSNDGISVPVTVIVRPPINNENENNLDDTTLKSKINENTAGDKNSRSSKGRQNHKNIPYLPHIYSQLLASQFSSSLFGIPPLSLNSNNSGTQRNEKENIPMMLSKQSTSIIPISSRDVQDKSQEDVIELDSDDETNVNNQSNSTSINPAQVPPLKKRKLDILREGGLEVTPISHGTNGLMDPHQLNSLLYKSSNSLLSIFPNITANLEKCQIPNEKTKSYPSSSSSSSSSRATAAQKLPQTTHYDQKKEKAIVTTKNPPAITAPPVQFQSINMFQTTKKIFGNPKELVVSVPNHVSNENNDCLDLTKKSSSHRNNANDLPMDLANNPTIRRLPEYLTIQKNTKSPNSMSPFQSNYPSMSGGDSSLQITLVKAQKPKSHSTFNPQKSSQTTSVSQPKTASTYSSPNYYKPPYLPPGIDITSSSTTYSPSTSKVPSTTSNFASNQNSSLASTSLLGNHSLNIANLGQSSSANPSPNPLLPFMDPLFLSTFYANPSLLSAGLQPADFFKFYKNAIHQQGKTPSSKT